MTAKKMPGWKDLWEERGKRYPHDDPAKLDGFDYAGEKLDEKQVDFLVEKIMERLDLNKDDLLLDAGCGAGMLLKPLSAHVKRAVGVDYASAMVDRCKKLCPGVEVKVAEIQDLPFPENTFDKIVCFSVFQYFTSLDHAGKVLNEFIRVCRPNGRVFIGDVPDEKTKSESIAHKKKFDQGQRWRSSVKAELGHIYYKREFFKDFFKSSGIKKYSILQQDIPRYSNAPFRFNVVLETSK